VDLHADQRVHDGTFLDVDLGQLLPRDHLGTHDQSVSAGGGSHLLTRERVGMSRRGEDGCAPAWVTWTWRTRGR